MSTLKQIFICLIYTSNYAFPALTNKTLIRLRHLLHIIIIFLQHSRYQILIHKKEHSPPEPIGLNRALSKNMYIHS